MNAAPPDRTGLERAWPGKPQPGQELGPVRWKRVPGNAGRSPGRRLPQRQGQTGRDHPGHPIGGYRADEGEQAEARLVLLELDEQGILVSIPPGKPEHLLGDPITAHPEEQPTQALPHELLLDPGLLRSLRAGTPDRPGHGPGEEQEVEDRDQQHDPRLEREPHEAGLPGSTPARLEGRGARE